MDKFPDYFDSVHMTLLGDMEFIETKSKEALRTAREFIVNRTTQTRAKHATCAYFYVDLTCNVTHCEDIAQMERLMGQDKRRAAPWYSLFFTKLVAELVEKFGDNFGCLHFNRTHCEYEAEPVSQDAPANDMWCITFRKVVVEGLH